MKLSTLQRMLMLGIVGFICILACCLMAFFAMNMNEAYADTNVLDMPTSFDREIQAPRAKLIVRDAIDNTDVEEEASKQAAKRDSAVQHLLGSAALGSAVGATSHLNQLKKSAFMPPLERAVYPYDVYYTVSAPHTFTRQAAMWGIPTNMLHELNPGFTDDAKLDAGTKLLVFHRSDYTPLPYSVGPTNRGRILNAWMMPEGDETDGYFLRQERVRAWATENTITSLMAGFKAYANQYPGAPRVNVGDFSKRRGGKITPHASHTSGRDVDIGFVHTVAPNEHHPEHFTRANATNVDAEKTWFVLKSIIQTGEVKVIYIDASVQKQLYQIAKNELNQAQLEAIFSIPKHKHSSSAILQHWPGHNNHAHIRFICPEDEPRCKN